MDSMFYWAPQMQKELTEAARFCREKNAVTVGLDARFQTRHLEISEVDPFEYLIIRLLTKPYHFLQPRIQPFNVQNGSQELGRENYRPPDCVIFFTDPQQETVIDSQTGWRYVLARKWERIVVLVPQTVFSQKP
jgi:hypothetical protein